MVPQRGPIKSVGDRPDLMGPLFWVGRVADGIAARGKGVEVAINSLMPFPAAGQDAFPGRRPA
ncbi:hypothetical protein AS038_10095 [Arthrobacter sp. NIO-1057]|nr:hypothetical protein AS038_10095 [Arthrobacter sp. NIO-1057]